MKILLVADVPNWAFDRDASAVIQYLPQYDISKTYTGRFNKSAFEKYDHVHFMNWLEGRPFSKRVSGGVSSHNFELLHKEDSEKFFPRYKALLATSNILYQQIKDSNYNVFYAPGGVHEDLFCPVNKPRTKEFVIGWTGQKTSGKIDIKGYDTILVPLMKMFENDPHIRFKLLMKNYKNAIPYKDMPRFYDDVDCQICTSLREGAPNPMFEAASSGKPLISTTVGAISECIEDGVNGYLLPTWDIGGNHRRLVDSFYDKIKFFKEHRDICEEMGMNSRRIIEENWRWKDTVKRWIPLFEHLKGT